MVQRESSCKLMGLHYSWSDLKYIWFPLVVMVMLITDANEVIITVLSGADGVKTEDYGVRGDSRGDNVNMPTMTPSL